MVARAMADGLPPPPRINHGERIAALEQREAGRDKRLEDMSAKLDEVLRILNGAKAVLWLGTKIGGVTTVCCAVIGAGVAIYKLF